MISIYNLINDENFKKNGKILRNNFDYNKTFNTCEKPNLNENEINSIISEVNEFLKSIKINKKIYNYILLAITSFIEMYGNNYKDRIYESISNSKIILDFEDGVTFKILNNNLIRNVLISNDYSISIELLNCIVHELRHVITSSFNKDIIRNGLSIRRYDNDNIFIDNKYLDEAYNTYFTEVLINNILKYKNINIKNKQINYLLKDINNPYFCGYYYSQEYIIARQLIKPLLDNLEFTNRVNIASIKGDINKLKLDNIGLSLDSIMNYIIYYYELDSENDCIDDNFIDNIEKFKKMVLEKVNR